MAQIALEMELIQIDLGEVREAEYAASRKLQAIPMWRFRERARLQGKIEAYNEVMGAEFDPD
jgi:hypothetical protein